MFLLLLLCTRCNQHDNIIILIVLTNREFGVRVYYFYVYTNRLYNTCCNYICNDIFYVLHLRIEIRR